MTKAKRGKLIVIDGIDGSGKATQTRLLFDRFKRAGVKVKKIDFPRYYDNFFGQLIGEYLSGRYGDFIKVDPRIASVLFAADRFESSAEIKKWLAAGYVVLADRYVSANQIHQGGKIKSGKERQKFLRWLDEMEYGVFALPQPDVVVYLDVPYQVSQKWLEKKKKDVAENNLVYLKQSRQCALGLAKTNKNWHKIECCQGNVCLSPKQIHEQVFAIVKGYAIKG